MDNVSDTAYHWFTSSALHWRAHNSLREVIRRQESADLRGSGGLRPACYNIWRVPGDASESYDIEYYQPKVDGAELIETVEYPKPRKRKA